MTQTMNFVKNKKLLYGIVLLRQCKINGRRVPLEIAKMIGAFMDIDDEKERAFDKIRKAIGSYSLRRVIRKMCILRWGDIVIYDQIIQDQTYGYRFMNMCTYYRQGIYHGNVIPKYPPRNRHEHSKRGWAEAQLAPYKLIPPPLTKKPKTSWRDKKLKYINK